MWFFCQLVLYDTVNKEESDTDEEEDSEIKENVFRDKEKEDIASNNHSTNRSSIKGTKNRPLKLLPNQDLDECVISETTIVEDLEETRDKFHTFFCGIFENNIFMVNNNEVSSDTITEEEKALDLTPFKNPLKKAKAKYLGPIADIIKILTLAYRTVFQISMWNDRYLSFWVSVGMLALAGIFLYFPWRLFFIALELTILGPQNWFIRKQKELANKNNSNISLDEKIELHRDNDNIVPLEMTEDLIKKENAQRKVGIVEEKVNIKSKDEDSMYNVVIPYSLVSFNRFNDWPPISSHSKAVPVASLNLPCKSKHINL